MKFLISIYYYCIPNKCCNFTQWVQSFNLYLFHINLLYTFASFFDRI